jgi:hypothetical protein
VCAVLVFAGLYPAAVQAGGNQGHQQSGLLGQAFVSLSYCVTLGSPPQPCPDAQPISGTVLVYSAAGKLVATVETDEDGFFKVNLKPADYLLTMYIPPPSPGAAGFGYLEATWVPFTVQKKEFTPAWVLSVFHPL